MTTKSKVKWYLKVADKHGRACNGGHGKYKLDFSAWSPGSWHANRKPMLCQSGWHVVDLAHVGDWDKRDCRVFVVQTRGASDGKMNRDGKMAFESFRCVTEISWWTVGDAIVRSLRGMTASRKNRLVLRMVENYRDHAWKIVGEFPEIQAQLEESIEKAIKRRGLI